MKTHALVYNHDDVVLEGHVAYNDRITGPLPGVLVVHEWRGLNDYARKRAEQLANMGYVGFAVDMYGQGVLAENAEQAGQLMTPFVADRGVCRARIAAAFTALKKVPLVDVKRIAVIGYCFGGLAALELARSGADIRAVVSFHGNLSTTNSDDAKNIKAKVLACHGTDNPLVPPAQVTAFEVEMRQAKVDWQLIKYGNTVHSFTFPGANEPANGLMYNAESDRRSWDHMRLWLAEALR